MDDEYFDLLRAAFNAYLLRLSGGGLEPLESYLSYDYDQVDGYQWQLFGNELVKDELREITNILNYWHGSLQRWHAWNNVIATYDADDAWELRREFLEAHAHQCLLQPSATRDTFTFVATNSMHQARLASNMCYRDFMDGDPKLPGDKPKHLTRRQKEERLAGLISHWPESADFMSSLRKIDDGPYRQETSDYRNRASHSIAPRLGIGITRAVVRSVVQATQMTRQSDGTFKPTPMPGKMSVSYGFGGTAPLDMEEARSVNLQQYRRARKCYQSYRTVLAAALVSMPSAKPMD